MQRRTMMLIAAAVLLIAGGWLWWRSNASRSRPTPEPFEASHATPRPARSPARQETARFESTAPVLAGATVPAATNASPLAYRLANTDQKNLLRDDRMILLENAVIDATKPVNFQVPATLQTAAEPGAYLVQARGAIGAAFRAAVQASGAEYVSFIPNNAWLVRAGAAAAQQLRGSGAVQAVLPWQPVFKLKSQLLVLAMQGRPLPEDTALNLLVAAADVAAVRARVEQQQGTVLAEDQGPFGAVVTVQLPAQTEWTALAQAAEVLLMEQAFPRMPANDLTRVLVGVAESSVVETNYLGLTGTNIMVGINDTGVDATHPDLAPRVLAATPAGLTDTNGHGTHVAGTIAGNGTESADTTVRGSSNPGVVGQYRGMAPGALLYSQRLASSDRTLQENTAKTNIFISNNSWTYVGDTSYSLAAAAYDAAVRDSLSGVTGSQPVLYVFPVGNGGGGSDGGGSGVAGSVQSPATAKNVVSVGAVELPRDITNIVTKISLVGTNQTTNTSTPWKSQTSSANQVAAFSARGNVGIGIEGPYGRVKPDVMAPGTFVVSTRSAQWDERAYYNPTSHFVLNLSDQIIGTNGLTPFSIFLPDNAVGFSIELRSNSDSPEPFPELPIYLRRNGLASTLNYDVRRTNAISVPPDLPGVGTAVGQTWSYGIGNPTGAEISIDIHTDIVVTNELGDYFQVLSNLNNSISASNAPVHYYRYESGTSMAAAAVSGTLALMQEFFERRLHLTNSPALMKALLVNGARSVGDLYNFQVQNSINYQGWGLVKLNNSLSLTVSNAFDHRAESSGDLKLFDQSPTNALATGQSQTRTIALDPEAGFLPLRVTLAWTDPPGNPAAGIKLVNDLDLVVTNLDTGEIYLGNDFPGSSIYTIPWDTNLPPNADAVNNLENVFISPLLGTNYSITVAARRVNVNAVTAHTNNVVQDYALVISCGSGELTNAFALTNQSSIVGAGAAQVTHPAATINQPDDFQAFFLEDQRVGANTPLLGTANGLTNQWHFYVVTNNTTFTNAAFLIAQQTDLAVPQLGALKDDDDDATRRYADLDLYVSTDANLTNLSPAALAAAFKSTSRNDLSGDELLQFTDAQPVYYIGVKSEDQMAGEYDFFAIFSLLPLGAEDANGFVRAYPMTGYAIPDGTPSLPGGTRFLAVTLPSTSGAVESVRRVIITNNVSHQNYGDIISSISHNSRVAFFDNHRRLEAPPYPNPPGPYQFLYDDSGERDFLNSIPTDGPGSLNNYLGELPGGTWYFSFSDDALFQVGNVNDLRLRVERQCEDDCSLTNTVAPDSWRYFSRNVPVEATNLTVCIQNITPNPQPLELYIRKGARPTQTAYDFKQTINPPGGCLTIDKFQLPPLTAGRYFIGIYNPSTASQTFIYTATVLLGPPPAPIAFNPTGTRPLLDDAATNHSIFVTDSETIARVNVGLSIAHPRVSDLAVTLISPRGTRVLLAENRGGTSTTGFGNSTVTTNFIPISATGGPAATNIFIDTGSTAGTVTINYDFLDAPDQMRVYYETTLLADTGMTNGTGTLKLNYGPGATTLIEIRMNELGNTNASTQWSFTASSYSVASSYLVFTDNTNLTTTPIKFALPPYIGAAGTNFALSDFEPPVLAQDYLAPTAGLPNGWNVITNQVTVQNDPTNAQAGSAYLALARGQIERVLPTVVGRNYLLTYWHRGPGVVGWWRGENNGFDQIYGNHGAVESGATYAPGEVGQAFDFTSGFARKVSIPDQPVFQLTNSLSIEGWIRPIGPGSQILWRGDRRGGYDPYFLQMNGDNTLGFIIANDVGPGGTSATVNAPLAYNQWWHVVGMLDGNTGVMSIYTNGALAAQTTTSIRPFAVLNASEEPVIGIGNVGTHEGFTIPFNGYIDEISLYSRALSPSEIRAIYTAGSSGKFDPTASAPQSLAKAEVTLGGATNVIFGDNTVWRQESIAFTATTNQTLLRATGLQPGLLLDSFRLFEAAGPRYVLPEESLKALEGENAYGLWQLEILDRRSGATNNVALVDWQLQFDYQTNTAPPRVITPGVPVDVTIPPGQLLHFVIDVPSVARFATNVLFNASANVGFYFNQNRPPLWGATNVGDVVFAPSATDWVETLSTTNTVPPTSTKANLLPGQRYYLAVESPNPPNNVPVTVTVYVDFDLRALPPVVDLTNGVPFCTVNPASFSLDYYRFRVSSNAVRAQFEINDPSGDMTLFLRRGLPPSFSSFDYLSATPSTNDEVITVFDFTQPIPLTPGDWYFAAANLSPGPVSYCAAAWEWPGYGTNVVITNVFLGTNSFCLTWSSLPGVRYLVEGVTNLNSTNWVAVSPTITGAGPTTTYCVPLPSPYQFFRVREGQALDPYIPPPVIIRIVKRFNGIEITWSGPPGQQYQVEWSPGLAPAAWTPFTEILTSITGIYSYLDDGSQTLGFGATRYYRLVLLP